MQTPEEQLEKIFKLLREILLSPKLTPEGWSRVTTNGNPPTDGQLRFAGRHGCEWNEKERRDLLARYFQCVPWADMALAHWRTEGAIRSELARLMPHPSALHDAIDFLLDQAQSK